MQSHGKHKHHHKKDKTTMISIFINNPQIQESKQESKNQARHEEKNDDGCAKCFEWIRKKF